MIEDLTMHIITTFTTTVDLVDKAFRYPYFEDREEINRATCGGASTFEIQEHKRRVNIMRPYQRGIAVYQLAKLRMLESYCDFFDYYFDRRDFELIQMDTDSMYMAISGSEIVQIIKPELREEYHNRGKAEFLPASKYHNRTPGLFKAEFQGTRMITLTSKC